jgi:hypothetical protein
MTGPDASREAKGSGWARVDPKIFAQRRQGGIVHMTRTKFTRNINGFHQEIETTRLSALPELTITPK